MSANLRHNLLTNETSLDHFITKKRNFQPLNIHLYHAQQKILKYTSKSLFTKDLEVY